MSTEHVSWTGRCCEGGGPAEKTAWCCGRKGPCPWTEPGLPKWRVTYTTREGFLGAETVTGTDPLPPLAGGLCGSEVAL